MYLDLNSANIKNLLESKEVLAAYISLAVLVWFTSGLLSI